MKDMRIIKRNAMRLGVAIAVAALVAVILQFVELQRSNVLKATASPTIDVEQREYTQFTGDGTAQLKALGDGVSGPDNTMGRGLNIEKFGTRLSPHAVVDGPGTRKTLDVEHNPCLWYSTQSGTSQWLEISQSDTKKEWSRKYGVGIEAGYKQGKPRPAVGDLQYQQSEGTTKFMPQYAADYMGLAPGAAGSVSGSVNVGSTSGWTSRQRHYEGRLYNALENDTIQYDPHAIPTSKDTCTPVEGLSEEDVLTRLTTNDFKTDVLNKLPADQFLDRYGDLIVTSGTFGAMASVFADFNSNTESKSNSVDVKVNGTIKGVTGGAAVDYKNQRDIIKNDGRLDSYSYGSFATPNWDIDNDASENGVIANKWLYDTSTAAKSMRQFIGGAVKNSGEGAHTNLEDIGKWVWEFIDSKMLAPSNVRYPSATECNQQYANNQEFKDDCLSRAGQVMTYADWIHVRYRTRLMEKGGMVGDEISQGPYVKNVYTSGDGYKLIGSYSIGTAKNNLHKMMQDDCDTAYECVYFDDYNNGRQSLTSHAFHNDGHSAWAGPILLGYSLTQHPEEALVNFDVIAGDTNRRKNCIRDTDVLYSKNGDQERGYKYGGYHYGDGSVTQNNELPVDFITCSHPVNGIDAVESLFPNGYWFSQDLNAGAGGKYIYFANRMRYNSNYPSYVDLNGHAHNIPITAIGLENAASDSDHKGLWPGEDGLLPGVNDSSPLKDGATKLSSGKLIPSNTSIWTKLNQNLNEGSRSGNPMYIYLAH